METKCPICHSTEPIRSFTGFHCPDCGENFATGCEIHFFRW